MKLKKNEHQHKEELETLLHKKSKVMPVDTEPEERKVSPGGFYGRKWFNHTPHKK